MALQRAVPASDTLTWQQAIEAQAEAERFASWAVESWHESRPVDASVQATIAQAWAQIAHNAVTAARA